jgi:hypothetical protein
MLFVVFLSAHGAEYEQESKVWHTSEGRTIRTLAAVAQW